MELASPVRHDRVAGGFCLQDRHQLVGLRFGGRDGRGHRAIDGEFTKREGRDEQSGGQSSQ